MTVKAASLPLVHRGDAVPPQHVFAALDNLHVRRIDAMPNAAKMVNSHSGWDWANKKLIGSTMGQPTLKTSIASTCTSSSPDPARCSFLHLGPETNLEGPRSR